MANRAYLYSTDLPKDYSLVGEEVIVCASSYMIPVFWYMLFEENNVQIAYTAAEGDKNFQYHRLVTEKDRGVSLACNRIERLVEIYGKSIAEHFLVFIRYVHSQVGSLLVCETCEIAMMEESPLKYEQELCMCISAFQFKIVEKKGILRRKNVTNEKWLKLLSQADINSLSTMPNVTKLAGYSWVNSVPWA